jgi:hypothetical protein
MHKNIIYSCFIICASVLFVQCGKKDPLRGCKTKGTNLECLINENLVKADSIGATYSLTKRHIYLYFRNRDTSTTSLISVYYPLQTLDLPIINKDTFGFASVKSTYGFAPFGVTNGNLKLEFRADSTICGEFFFAEQNLLNVNQGWFSNIRVKAVL